MSEQKYEGGCACGHVRYQLTSAPLFTHCCHCHHCQRESGSAFALNAMIETDKIKLLGAEPVMVDVPTKSGEGQTFARCPNCQIALWSHYAGAYDKIAFIRVGTLDEPDNIAPDIHIYTQTKRDGVILPDDIPAVEEYYDRKDYWPKASLRRRADLGLD
ncbi:MAG TPA: aldehyde-activating protein [Hellea balneolensis]|uniref:Aldehyde-activating protein n=1 Tax=Hellea balneolensis TaxID=287478 RepID=A0A7C3CBT8_9PROT|nr:aldehyde-activating protein [Hellea balneolensis]